MNLIIIIYKKYYSSIFIFFYIFCIMEDLKISFGMLGGIFVFSTYKFLLNNKEYDKKININILEKNKNNDINLIRKSNIEEYLCTINEINNLNFILIDINKKIIIIELICDYLNTYYKLFYQINFFKINFETEGKVKTTTQYLNIIFKLEDILTTKIDNKYIFDGNYEISTTINKDDIDGYEKYKIIVKSLFFNELLKSIGIVDSNSNFDFENDQDMNDFINNELEFKNTHIEDINSMISQFSANQELNEKYKEKYIKLLFILYNWNDEIVSKINCYLNILKDEIEKIKLIKIKFEKLVNELDKKIQVFEEDDIYIKNYIKKYDKSYLSVN